MVFYLDHNNYITNAGFNLERGQEKNTQHITPETLKQITNFENIKYELNNQEINLIDTNNISLLQQQNKELVVANNKLKLNLSKCYTMIKNYQTISNENTSLRLENQKLRQENNYLINYISKTFEVVKHLFDFPVERLKDIVNNFINSYEK